MKRARPPIGGIEHRTARIDTGAAGDSRRFSAALSSEAPVLRLWGWEVLVHETDAVDLSRTQDGRLPLLAGHDQDELPRPGNVEDVRLAGRKLRGELALAETARGDELLAAVRDGYLEEVSLGYRISEIEPDGEDEDGVPRWRVTRWQPIEASLVNLPADVTVGVGRSEGVRMAPTTEDTPRQSRSERRRERESQDDERNRVAAIMLVKRKLGSDDPRVGELADKFIEEGRSEADFCRAVVDLHGERAMPVTPSSPDIGAGFLGLPRRELERYSLRKAVLGAAHADVDAGFEREVSKALAARMGREVRGMLVPFEVFSTRTVSKAGTSSATIATTVLAAEFIDVLRAKSIVLDLGVRMLPGLVGDCVLPTKTAATTPYWVAESADVTPSDPSLTKITLTPHTVGALTSYSRKMLLQSTPAIEWMLRDDLAGTIAAEIDRVVLNGSGSGAEPIGILNRAIGAGPSLGSTGGPIT